jgi:hypothetical protein
MLQLSTVSHESIPLLYRLEDGEDSLSVDELRLQLRQKENLLTETRLEALRHFTRTFHIHITVREYCRFTDSELELIR